MANKSTLYARLNSPQTLYQVCIMGDQRSNVVKKVKKMWEQFNSIFILNFYDLCTDNLCLQNEFP